MIFAKIGNCKASVFKQLKPEFSANQRTTPLPLVLTDEPTKVGVVVVCLCGSAAVGVMNHSTGAASSNTVCLCPEGSSQSKVAVNQKQRK